VVVFTNFFVFKFDSDNVETAIFLKYFIVLNLS